MTDTTIPAADREVTASHNREMIPKLSKFELLEDHGEFVTRKTDLLARAGKIPEDVTAWTDEDVETCIALGRDFQKYLSDVEATRKRIGQPYTEVTTAINDLFNTDWRNAVQPKFDAVKKLTGKSVDHRAAVEQARLTAEAEARRVAATATLEKAAESETAGQHTRAEIQTEQAMLQEHRADQIDARAANSTHQDLGRARSSAGTMTGVRKMTRAIDRATVDLEAIRPYLAADAIERAVVAYDNLNGNMLAADKRSLVLKAPLKGVQYGTETVGAFRS